MALDKELHSRSGSICELCGSSDELQAYTVPPGDRKGLDGHILACGTCRSQIEDPSSMDSNHWRCLNDSMWSSVPAVQVMAWRLLHRLRQEGWPNDLIDMLYLDDETLEWAKFTGEGIAAEDQIKHLDSNGAELAAGDTVVLIKDLKVKGANFTAKRGTAVRRISLVADNPTHIEGKVNGQQIVILTQYVKKSK
jgi:protein PhnA